MKTQKASNKALKHIVYCIIIIIAFVITITRVQAKNENTIQEIESVVPLKPQLDESLLELKIKNIQNDRVIFDNPRIIEKDINYYISEYNDVIEFFSKAFGYDVQLIKQDLIDRNKDITVSENNIGNILDQDGNVIVYPNREISIVEYFYDLLNNTR